MNTASLAKGEDVAILIVEDSPTQAEQLRYILEKENYRIFAARDGMQALERVNECAPTLIISDILMPKMDGYELCRRIKASPELRDTPVILLTSLSEPMAVFKALECGADHFITKPCSDEYLLNRVWYILTNRELRKDTYLDMGIDVFFAGKKHHITAERVQIIDFLISAFESALVKHQELENANRDLRESKTELEKMANHLEELNRLKNRFLSMAAHDLRNPLVSIKGFSELMLGGDCGVLPAEHREFLETINSAAEGMLALVNDLLDISVIESGSLSLQPVKASLNELVLERIRIGRISADKKRIGITTSLECEIEGWFDRERLGQVVDNLLGNAVKYSPPGSHIAISLESAEGGAMVSIRDEGPGIAEEEIGRLFGEFRRLAARPTAGEHSTGLGLAIVKKIIDAHGGKVEVQSRLGKGSTFSFFIPLRDGGGEVCI
jgi:signal transduction histidine kinase